MCLPVLTLNWLPLSRPSPHAQARTIIAILANTLNFLITCDMFCTSNCSDGHDRESTMPG
jgi:hypothetical protein